MQIELTQTEVGLAILALNLAECEQGSKAVQAFLDGNETRRSELLDCCKKCANLAAKLEQMIAQEFRKTATNN